MPNTTMQDLWARAQATCLNAQYRGRRVVRVYVDSRTRGAWNHPSQGPGCRDHLLERLLPWLERRRGGILACECCGEHDRDGCDCLYCESCERRHLSDEGWCGDCDRCRDCCECVRCEHCGNVMDPDYACGDCGRCESCGCGCGIPTFDGDYNVRHGTPTKVFPRYVGLEIECGMERIRKDESRALTSVVKKWKGSIQHDGSISCGGAEREITTAPACGDALREQVQQICARLADMGAKVDQSCGLHAHVDAKSLNWSQILGVVRAYLYLEPALYMMVPESRRGHYSKPWGTMIHDSEVFEGATVRDRENRLGTAMYGSLAEYERMKRAPYKHEARYHGLNLNALLLYGTIEFRLHSGTVDANKILNWAAICSAIVEWGRIHGEKSVKALNGESPWRALERIVLSVTGSMEIVKYARARRDKFQAPKRHAVGLAPRPTTEPEGSGTHEASEGRRLGTGLR